MKTENKVLMAQAREALSGKWWSAIKGFISYFLIVIVFNIVVGFLIGIIEVVFGLGKSLSWVTSLPNYFITGPMSIGLAYFYLQIARKETPVLRDLLKGFKKFWIAVGAYLLMLLFVVLWMLLLIIPGIIAGLSYSQTFFILAEDDSIGGREAITKSKKMMYGYKWKYFCLGLRFFGWALLCILTFGIGFLWLFPYMMVSYAKFYDDVKNAVTSPEVSPQV